VFQDGALILRCGNDIFVGGEGIEPSTSVPDFSEISDFVKNRGSSINHKIKDFGFIGTYRDLAPEQSSVRGGQRSLPRCKICA